MRYDSATATKLKGLHCNRYIHIQTCMLQRICGVWVVLATIEAFMTVTLGSFPLVRRP